MDPDEPPGDLEIALANEQAAHAIDEVRLLAAVRSVLEDAGRERAMVSVAVVDDATIHELNRRYLDHDWPTDVLSFVLEESDGYLEGEIVVSADTAAAAAPEFGWSAADELLLYAIHGTLHLVGYDDKTAAAAREMRAAESRHLARLGVCLPPLPSGEGRGEGALTEAEAPRHPHPNRLSTTADLRLEGEGLKAPSPQPSPEGRGSHCEGGESAP